MKSSAILFVGGLVVAGAVAYGVYRYINSQKNTVVKPPHESDINSTEQRTENTTTSSPVVADLNSTKEEAVSSFKVTRKEAEKAIEESLNTIFSGTTEDIVTENAETLNKISSDLEGLLK